tara:strand:+ start:813 stop:977 length:165 start_codon:yes stop_codon:yes gene_type:complete
MWNSENKLLCLYRATGRFGELPPEVRGNIYTEKSFTINWSNKMGMNNSNQCVGQ